MGKVVHTAHAVAPRDLGPRRRALLRLARARKVEPGSLGPHKHARLASRPVAVVGLPAGRVPRVRPPLALRVHRPLVPHGMFRVRARMPQCPRDPGPLRVLPPPDPVGHLDALDQLRSGRGEPRRAQHRELRALVDGKLAHALASACDRKVPECASRVSAPSAARKGRASHASVPRATAARATSAPSR